MPGIFHQDFVRNSSKTSWNHRPALAFTINLLPSRIAQSSTKHPTSRTLPSRTLSSRTLSSRTLSSRTYIPGPDLISRTLSSAHTRIHRHISGSEPSNDSSAATFSKLSEREEGYPTTGNPGSESPNFQHSRDNTDLRKTQRSEPFRIKESMETGYVMSGLPRYGIARWIIIQSLALPHVCSSGQGRTFPDT
jgi:hypothetical protein